MHNQDFHPDWFSKPGDSILSLMHRRAVPAVTLADSLDGNMATLRGLVAGLQPIDSRIAQAISRVLGGTADFWIRRQENYDKALDRAVEAIAETEGTGLIEKVLSPGPAPRGRVSTAAKAKEIRVRLAFYNVNGMQAWQARYGKDIDTTRFRTSGSFASDEGAVSLWLRSGELEADLISAKPWNPKQLEQDLPKLRRLSLIRHPDRMLPKLREALADVGVALVVQKAPRGCRASGASRFLSRAKAMLLMSLRHRSDDHFWFTLFHELGHLLLHGDRTFIDEEGMPEDELEKQANEFARRCIVPVSSERRFELLPASREAILRFSVSVGVAPGVIVGQMQHKGVVGYEKLNFLKRQYKWDEVNAALSNP